MATRLYSLYVPLQTLKPKFTIEKEAEIETKESKNEQLGFGSVTESESLSNNEPSSQIEPSSSNISLNKNESEKDDNKSSEISLKRPRMEEGILDSFMHPKIKVGKIEVNKNEKKKVDR